MVVFIAGDPQIDLTNVNSILYLPYADALERVPKPNPQTEQTIFGEASCSKSGSYGIQAPDTA